eukprot:8873828-Alexandrium_andersonii.AAC.1
MVPGVLSLNCAHPITAPICPHCKASSGGFGVALRAEPDGGDDTGRRARRRRFWGDGGNRRGRRSLPEAFGA